MERKIYLLNYGIIILEVIEVATYEVKVTYGNDETNIIKVEDADKFQVTTGAYFVQAKNNEVLFSAPIERVVYIKKV